MREPLGLLSRLRDLGFGTVKHPLRPLDGRVLVACRTPAATLSLVLLAAGVYAAPVLGQVLVYDRTAILSGQVWRLITGNWVHFSTNHLVYDLLAFGTAGWIIEGRGQRGFC